MKKYSKLGINRSYLNQIKNMCEKSTANIILMVKRVSIFPPKLGTKQGCLVLAPLCIIVLEILASTRMKENKNHTYWKGRKFIFADGMAILEMNLQNSQCTEKIHFPMNLLKTWNYYNKSSIRLQDDARSREHYKTLMKRKDLNKGKVIPKLIYRFSTFPIIIQIRFLTYKDSQNHLSIPPIGELNGYISLIIRRHFHYVEFSI